MCEYIQNIGPLCTCYHLKGNLETEPTVPNPLPLVPTLSLFKDIKSSLHIAMIKYAALRRSANGLTECKMYERGRIIISVSLKLYCSEKTVDASAIY